MPFGEYKPHVAGSPISEEWAAGYQQAIADTMRLRAEAQRQVAAAIQSLTAALRTMRQADR